jgi:hypothetical protein
MARKGRKPKSKDQKLADALARTAPNDRVMELRRVFSFVRPPADKRQDGRNGEIDSEVCDAIGQLCALGLFDGHGHDPIEMRDKGRFWGCHYAKLMKGSAVRTGNYERKDRSQSTGALTGSDMLFDRMDETLGRGFERSVLLSLVVDPLIGHLENVPWAQSLIDEELLKRHRLPVDRVVRFPDCQDRAYLLAAVRGLCCLVDGALPSRHQQMLGRAA